MDDDLARPRYGRHNAGDGIAFTRSARKHRIAHDDIRHVVMHPLVVVPIDHAHPRRRRYLYAGPDADGRMLEVIVIKQASGQLLVIHAMPLRPKYAYLIDTRRS